jgi:NTP pyrophosphatase (non-canonical NTP hydrolase)
MNQETVNKILAFRDERNWKQFHTGENLAKSIVLEAAELLENYQWSSEAKDAGNLKEELADIMIYCVLFADVHHLNIDDIILEKLEKNARKYPVEKAFGKSKKYNEL